MTQVTIQSLVMEFLVDRDRKIIITFKQMSFKEDIRIHL